MNNVTILEYMKICNTENMKNLDEIDIILHKLKIYMKLKKLIKYIKLN